MVHLAHSEAFHAPSIVWLCLLGLRSDQCLYTLSWSSADFSLSLPLSCAPFLVLRHSSRRILKHSKQANASWVLYSFLPPPFLFSLPCCEHSWMPGRDKPFRSFKEPWEYLTGSQGWHLCLPGGCRAMCHTKDWTQGATRICKGHPMVASQPTAPTFVAFSFFIISQHVLAMLFSADFHSHFSLLT